MTRVTTSLVKIPGAGLYRSHSGIDGRAALSTALLIARDADRAFSRDPDPGHCCASAFVLSHDHAHLLMMHHVKYDAWVQPGGHCDGDRDFLAVARKELAEETGLEEAELIDPAPFHVEIHEISPWKDVPAHLHYDVRYLFRAPRHARIRSNAESNDVTWMPRDRLGELAPGIAGLLPA